MSGWSRVGGLVAAAALGLACARGGHASGAALAGTRWLLDDLAGKGVVDRAQATLEFTGDGTVSGQGSCNRFGGPVTLAGDSISLGPLVATRMFCGEGITGQETEYLAALDQAVRYEVRDSFLYIHAAGRAEPLRFVRAPEELAGPWVVVGHHTPGAAAMGEDEASRWHGRPIRLSPDIAVSPGTHCDRPTYTMRTAPRDSFLAAEYELPAGALAPLAGLERLTVLEVSCQGAPLPAMGAQLIAVDDGTALAPWDGVFFELARDRDFRAVGQEPGWELRLREGGHIRFIYDYGSDTVTAPVPPRQRSPESGAILYHARTGPSDLQVVIEPAPCTDAMSGHPFETTVTVILNGSAYRGCGGPLPD